MDIETGNCNQLDTNGTGWFIGYSDWAKTATDERNLRFMQKNSLAHTVHAKWMTHPKDDDRGTHKPPSDGRTISIFVSKQGVFRIQFAPTKEFADEQIQEVTLKEHGDFVIWGEAIHHRWYVDEGCTIMTLRWIPINAHDG